MAEVPRDAGSSKQVIDLLPPGFRSENSRHFTVYTDARPQWIATQRMLLDRTHHQVCRFARRMGWDVSGRMPRQVVILFADREDYAQFSQQQDHVTAEWIAGYYSPTNRWVVFYDIESNPSLVNARTKLEEMEKDLQAMRDEARGRQTHEHGNTMASMVEHYREHLDGEHHRVERFVEQVSTATTTHEAAHQILYALGIQKPGVAYPFWLSEGFATCFETDAPYEAFGPDHSYAPREEKLREFLTTDSLEPLERFVTIGDVSDRTRDGVDVLYHQAYGFMRWAARFRRDQLRDYVELLNARSPGAICSSEHLELFEQVFGDVRSVERAWLAYEREQQP